MTKTFFPSNLKKRPYSLVKRGFFFRLFFENILQRNFRLRLTRKIVFFLNFWFEPQRSDIKRGFFYFQVRVSFFISFYFFRNIIVSRLVLPHGRTLFLLKLKLQLTGGWNLWIFDLKTAEGDYSSPSFSFITAKYCPGPGTSFQC